MRSELLYLVDIFEAARAVDRFITDVEKEAFFSNEMLQSAILQKITVIGEAVTRLSSEIKKRYPEVDWTAIVATRNIIVHVYFSVNWETIWSAATEDMLPLQDQIRQILLVEFPDFDIETNI